MYIFGTKTIKLWQQCEIRQINCSIIKEYWCDNNLIHITRSNNPSTVFVIVLMYQVIISIHKSENYFVSVLKLIICRHYIN